MDSETLGKNYDKIAQWWTGQMEGSDYGLAYVQKAMDLAGKNASVLDIGCGSNGRVMEAAFKYNCRFTGIDLSNGMLNIARQNYPGTSFIHGDFIKWLPSEKYDLVIAWDSLFHTPRKLQEKATHKMCRLLNDKGVLLFTAGGIDDERKGEMEGVEFEYGSLHFQQYLNIMEEMGCRIILMEKDQHPLDHMVFLGQKI